MTRGGAASRGSTPARRSSAAARTTRAARRASASIAPGEVVTSWGTSGTVLAPTARPLVDPRLRAHTFCHVLPDVWYLMGVVLSAGGAFAWYQDQLARELAGVSDATARLDAEAASVPRGAEGVTFLPYLQGERTPHRDASARGAILGLSLAHTRAHLTRAVLEGDHASRCATRSSILQALGLAPSHLLLTGGGAKSALLRRLQAEIFGLPVRTVNREEGPAYGAALLAAVGAGAFPDLACRGRGDAHARATLPCPIRTLHEEYAQPYARFRAVVPGRAPGPPDAWLTPSLRRPPRPPRRPARA